MKPLDLAPISVPLANDIARFREAVQAEGILRGGTAAGTSDWRFDLRPILLRGDLISIVARTFWNQFAAHWPFQVCGLELAAIPLITAIILEGRNHGHDVSGFFVRKERKPYGSGRLVEGRIDNYPAICVDDLLNTGSSAERIARILDKHPTKLLAVFAIVDFASQRGVQWRERRRVPVVSMFGPGNFGLSLGKKNGLPPLKNFFEPAWHFRPQRCTTSYHIAQKSTPAIGGGRIYFGTEEGVLCALNLASGEVAWTFRIASSHKKGIGSSPLLMDGKLFFGAYDGNLYCLDAASGKELWRSAAAEWIGSSACCDSARNSLYIGLEFALAGCRGALAAVAADDGHLMWSFPVAAYQHGSPVFVAETDLIYFGSNDGSFHCLRGGTGEENWRFSAGSAIRGAPELSVEKNLAVFGTFAGDVFGLDAEVGTERFHWKTHGEIYSKPLIVQDRCFVSCADKKLYIYDLGSGAVAKEINLGSRSFTSPSLAENSVFVGTASGAIAEIEPRSLNIIGAVQLLDCITSPICFDPQSNTFFAICNAGEMYAFRRASDAKTPISKQKTAIPEPHDFGARRPGADQPKATRMLSLVGRVPGISVIATEVIENHGLFSEDRSRQTKISVQRETEYIPLRRAARNGRVPINDNELVEDTRFSGAFPVLMNLLKQIAEAQGGMLDRAMVVKLPSGGRVYPHVDEGRYYLSRDRYHLVVQTCKGASIVRCGTEVVEMDLGEVWWLNNKELHSSVNDSSTDRVHVVFDVARSTEAGSDSVPVSK